MKRDIIPLNWGGYCICTGNHDLPERRALDAEGIQCFRFGREIKLLRWDQIQQLGILRKERQHRRGISQLFPVVIPKGIEPFAPTMEFGYDYLGRNRRHIIAEQIKYAPMFEKHYGPMHFGVRNYSRRLMHYKTKTIKPTGTPVGLNFQVRGDSKP